MFTIILVVHVIVSITLVLIVLLQVGKGAALGAAFGGGSSQTLFGSAGPASFLTKLTTVAAIIFMITSMTLSMMSAGRGNGSIIPQGSSPAATQPAAPTAPSQVPASRPSTPNK